MDFNMELKRNHYYTGKRINKEDLIIEQNYFIDKIRAINKMLIGYGIVTGLSVDDFSNKNKRLVLNEGIGIDSHGNFITVLNKREFKLPRSLKNNEFVYLKYVQTDEDRTPIAQEDACSENCTYNHLLDDVQLYISKEYEVPATRNICTEKRTNRKDIVTKEPILFIGQCKIVQSTGAASINGKDRVYVHTSNELFKLLCKINQSYVSSVNGLTGDLSLIASIGDVLPNEDGAIELIGGNNVSIETKENQIKINTKSGFYKEYHISVAARKTQTINHSANRYPVVDVYKKELDGNNFDVHFEEEVRYRARDTEVDFDDYLKEQDIKLFNDKFKKSNNKKLKVKTVLNKHNVLANASAKVLNVLEKNMHYYEDRIYVTPKYNYKKIVGREDSINIEVTHLNNSSVKIKNLSNVKVDLMIILNT